ncbi:MAG: hypothetical protein AB7S38_06070 [Vulcanimicrobiota bacterium]
MEFSLTEACPDRPFTHPDESLPDLEHLERMLELVREFPQVLPRLEGERRGRAYRLFRLRADLPAEGAIVGFFGKIRDDYPMQHLMQVDDALVAQFPQARGLAAYCSLERGPGQWGNLAVFDTSDDRSAWPEVPNHNLAVDLAPRCYHHIRLHLGRLEQGRIVIEATRYIDYDSQPTWKAKRRVVGL